MQQRHAGFTLIELVMVILILGILAATAIPKFTNLQGDAQTAATESIAGALGSASAINLAVRSLNSSNGVAVTDCTDVENALDGPLDAAKYTIGSTAIANGANASCVLSGPNTTTANFTGHGIL